MTVQVLVTVDVDPSRLRPCGPVERDASGAPDVFVMIDDRIRFAFHYVEGFRSVKVEPAEPASKLAIELQNPVVTTTATVLDLEALRGAL